MITISSKRSLQLGFTTRYKPAYEWGDVGSHINDNRSKYDDCLAYAYELIHFEKKFFPLRYIYFEILESI